LDTKAADPHFQRHEGPRTVRGGQSNTAGRDEPRSLRGGGGTKPIGASPEVKREPSGLFSRLLGPKA
jgi:hypothetical protein